MSDVVALADVHLETIGIDIPYSGKLSERNIFGNFQNVVYFPKIYFRKTFVFLLATSDYSNSEHR